jgi:hypothetical protein
MTSSPTPDISLLSLSSQPSHPRLHDTYDYDPSAGNLRPQYHFATAPPVPPGQPPYNPLSMNQPPKNNKTSRAGLPSVRLLLPPRFFPADSVIFHFIAIISNGSMAARLSLTIALFLLRIILTFPRAEARHLFLTLMPRVFRPPIKVPKTRLYPPLLSSKTSLLMSNARPFWKSSYVFCYLFRPSPSSFPK